MLLLRSVILMVVTRFAAVHFFLVGRGKERELSARFGPPDQDHRVATPRFFPRPFRRSHREP
jgi:protein-S-isoprenylcysteine O-methyltransferase Ste14